MPRPDTLPHTCLDTQSCVECEPVANPLCDQTCFVGDCDDLPDARDPWPGVCNPVLHSYDFKSWIPDWQRIHGADGIYIGPCGVLQIHVPTWETWWIELLPKVAALLPKEYLLEARFEPPVTPGSWVVRMAAHYVDDGSESDECRVTYDPSAQRISLRSNVGSRSNDASGTHSAVSGGWVLQSYREGGAHVCRLGTLVAKVSSAMQLTGGTVRLEAISPEGEPPFVFHLDYVRIFGLP